MCSLRCCMCYFLVVRCLLSFVVCCSCVVCCLLVYGWSLSFVVWCLVFGACCLLFVVCWFASFFRVLVCSDLLGLLFCCFFGVCVVFCCLLFESPLR